MELVIQLIDCSWRKCSSLITLRSFIFHFSFFSSEIHWFLFDLDHHKRSFSQCFALWKFIYGITYATYAVNQTVSLHRFFFLIFSSLPDISCGRHWAPSIAAIVPTHMKPKLPKPNHHAHQKIPYAASKAKPIHVANHRPFQHRNQEITLRNYIALNVPTFEIKHTNKIIIIIILYYI